jgi:hypothetical protein
MATLRDIENCLPSGFHDARVHSCEFNFGTRTLCFHHLEISVGDPDSSDSDERARYRAATLKFTEVAVCEFEAPHSIPALLTGKPPWIDLVQHDGDLLLDRDLPADLFRACFFVQNWNGSVLIAARDAEFAWLPS